MKLVFVATVAAIVVLILSGCGQPSVPATTPQKNATGPKRAKPAEPVAFTNSKGEILCPVTGDVIADKSKAVGHQDFNGKRYFFCCAGCPETFAKAPEKYADGKAIAAGETGHA
jgi:YHS domain-containing protein